MLISLRLKNFAVIEETEMSFGPGLTVLTGETGAGKSILVDALALLAGGRAEMDVIRAQADEAVVEGIFGVNEQLLATLRELGLPDDGAEIVIRRTVGRQARGRVYVNGALTTVAVLQRLMRGQVDIAGQHEHMALFEPGTHLGLLDSFGGVAQHPAAQAYRQVWASWKEALSVRDALGGDAQQAKERLDFVAYQLDELERLALQPGEDVHLEAERKRLGAAERLKQCIGSADALLCSGEHAAGELVGRALQRLAEGERFDESLQAIRAHVLRAQAELEEASRAVSNYLHSIDDNPSLLERVDERLDAIRRLGRKYGTSVEGLMEKRDALSSELAQLQHWGERREEADTRCEQLRLEVDKAAMRLTEVRTHVAAQLTHSVTAGLERLAMGRARFVAVVNPIPVGPHGADAVDLLFGANAGEPLRPLAKVASGGEASRVMLALKAALAQSDASSCSVFDEADAGIGGAAADVVGRLIKEISTYRQVLCITHLPQVAAYADVHLRIDKRESRGRTTSRVQQLQSDEKQHELARMLSGVEVSREALGAASALLRAAQVRRSIAGKKRKEARPCA